MGVQTPSRSHREQSQHWKVIDDLLGGTQQMRGSRELYLPRQKFETKEDYDNRINSATLYPAYRETLGSMRGRVFASSPIFHDVPKWITDEVFKDVDRNGQSMNIFLPQWFEAALAYGHAGVLVDSPEFDAAPTLAATKEKKLHPYYVLVKPTQILDARVMDGALLQLRLAVVEQAEDPKDIWNTRDVKTVRVYTKTAEGVTVEIFEEKTTADNQVEYVSRGVKALGKLLEIPFVCFYTGFVAQFHSVPPYADLAYLNVKHWATQSSYDAIVILAMIPILTLIGADPSTNLLIGSKSAVKIQNPDGDLKYTEHSGAAMKTGREALDKLKEEMRESGAKLLLPQLTSANKTATQAAEEAQRENSPLSTMVVDFANAFRELVRVTCLWRAGESLPEKCRLELRPNLKPDFAPTDTAQVLINAADRSYLSLETLFYELQRRSIIQDTSTWEEEKKRIEADPPGYLMRSLEVKESTGNKQNEPGQDANPLPQDQNQ